MRKAVLVAAIVGGLNMLLAGGGMAADYEGCVAGATAAVLQSAKGEVVVYHKASANRAPQVGMSLPSGTQVHTGAQGEAVVALNGALYNVPPSSVLMVREENGSLCLIRMPATKGAAAGTAAAGGAAAGGAAAGGAAAGTAAGAAAVGSTAMAIGGAALGLAAIGGIIAVATSGDDSASP